ncbi:MAG: MaoC family dehydratase [Gammaproteobacteria bacterium]
MRNDDAAGGAPGRAEIGYRWPPAAMTVTRAEQLRLHGWCDIAPAVFGDVADPGLVARPPILANTAAIRATRPGWGPVHLVQRVLQRRPVALDESLICGGEVTALTAHARGTLVTSRWSYRDASGAEVFVVTPEVLMLDPAAAATPSTVPGTGSQQAPGGELLARHQCTPQTTRGYCAGSSNLIHLDTDYARGFGLRAPIIAGVQTINFLLAPLYREGPRAALAFSVRFRRPVFWDEALAIHGERDASGALVRTRASNADGRVVAELHCEAAA